MVWWSNRACSTGSGSIHCCASWNLPTCILKKRWYITRKSAGHSLVQGEGTSLLSVIEEPRLHRGTVALISCVLITAAGGVSRVYQ